MKKKQEEEEQRKAANKPAVVKSKAKKKEPAGLDDLLSAGLAKGKGKKKWLDRIMHNLWYTDKYIYLEFVGKSYWLIYWHNIDSKQQGIGKIGTAKKLRVYFIQTPFWR